MVTEYVSKAWKAYKRNALSLIPAMIVILLISMASVGIVVMSMMTSMTESMLAGDFTAATFMSLMQSLSVGIAVMLIGILITIALQVGVVKMTVEALKGRTKVSTMFSTAKKKGITAIATYILALVIAGAVFGVFALLGFAAGVTAGFVMLGLGALVALVVLIFFAFMYQAIVIDNAGPVDALKLSFNFVKTNFLAVIALYVLYIVAAMILGLLPVIGTLLTMAVVAPVFLMALTAMYMDKKRRKGLKRPAKRKK